MSGSHLRVELRSPKRSLDGGYGFDLTKYCASCWSRLGRILKRGARCGVCGRRVCKGCRHFVAAKEWICSLCYKKKYTPEEIWHDDANTKRYKGSVGKSGTYLLRLTDWSAHGVLEMHEVRDFQPGRIHSFTPKPISPISYSFKNKVYKRNLKIKPKYYHEPVRYYVNYPLAQHDIQLKNWKTLDETMNPQSFKENHLKYTSVNLKQKRREMRECRGMSLGRGRHPDGTPNDPTKKRGHFNRINSTKREHLESPKTLFYDYGNPSTSSTRRANRSNGNSSANPSWQREHRRSRSKNGNNFAQPAVLHKNEPHMRLSVRGTRIFGRRKSYRAYPAPKGDARASASAIKCRSSSLPCELSQVESPDYDFWNSGFVQTRVRRLEEELTAKCDDKYSYTHDYEIQSLCSLKLEKILPDGDDYRIAYLSSTSQESSLDYMDDNYCTIGMGTLDVKLNKKCLLSGHEDWDLTFSSTDENDTSSDDDEFFYQKYDDHDSFSTRNYYCRNISDWEDTERTPMHGKPHSNISGTLNLEDTPKSITQQIHENVDRIFCNVMNYEFDIQYPPEEKSNDGITLQYSSSSSNVNLSENQKAEKQESSNFTPDKDFFYSLQNNEVDNFNLHSLSENSLSPITKIKLENHKGLINVSVNDFSQNLSSNETESEKRCHDVNMSKSLVSAAVPFQDNCLPNDKSSLKDESLKIYENLSDVYISNNSFRSDEFINFRTESGCVDKSNAVSKCLFSESESINREEKFKTLPSLNILQYKSNELLQTSDSEYKLPNDSFSYTYVPNHLNEEFGQPDVCEDSAIEKNLSVNDDFETEINTFSQSNDTTSVVQNIKNYKKSQENFRLLRKSGINEWLMKNKLNQCKITGDTERKNSAMRRTNSFLEAELIIYEPLCTPFAEIYFITYGKKYPTKYNDKPTIPRRIFSGVEDDIIINPINEHIILVCGHLQSLKAAMQKTNYINNENKAIDFKISNCNGPEKHASNRCLTGNFESQNDNYLATKSSEFENKTGDIDIQSRMIFLYNKKIFIPFDLLLYDIKGMNLSEHFLDINLHTFLREGNTAFQHSVNEHQISCLKWSELVLGNNSGVISFQVPKNYFVRDILNFLLISLDREKLGENFERFFLENWLSLQLFLFKCIDRGTPDGKYFNSKKRKTYSLNNFYSATNLSILNQIAKSLNNKTDTNNSKFLTSLSSRRKSAVDSMWKYKSYFHHSKLNKFQDHLHYPENKNNSRNRIEFPEICNFYRSKKSFKALNSDIFNTKKWISGEKKYSILKRKIEKYSSGKKYRVSKSYKLLNYKKHLSINKKYNPSIHNANRSKCKSIFIYLEQCFKQYQQCVARNRNYGNSYSSLKETEITNEVPHVGETSESRFAVESLKPTTSSTGNATFVEYLFLPQLASVRDTAEAHLSVSSIQLCFQSVPAVQRRLADRESRFVHSGKDHKHGSLCAATASGAAILTDEDFSCGAQNLCVSEILGDGYPFLSWCFEREGITRQDHESEDYVCFGSVPTGLQQLICDQVTVGGINLDSFNPKSLPSFVLQQNMATCEEDPRLINKVTRTPGRNISKLKKFFDSRESVSDSDVTSSKKMDCSSPQSSPSNNNIKTDASRGMDYNAKTSQQLSNGHDERDSTTFEISSETSVTQTSESVSYKSEQRISSTDIPYCRKVSNVSNGGDLWKNVDIGLKTSNEGLWSSAHNDSNSDDSHDIHMDIRQVSNSFVSSTEDLHNLIAASRAELSKKKEPLLSDKSTLENYFTSFENSKPQKFLSINTTNHFIRSSDSSDFQVSDSETFQSPLSYDCDVDEMNFDDEDVTLSDTSSDEEIRCNPPINTHYLPAYALHTIIEESCEESERDSRTATPTNEPVTSKLERYFSWDIINDTETDNKRKEEDESTVYSDSLSEVSGSLNGETNKEIDPTQLASSRLEKYFTSGLVGNENYFYPDDAEFLEDAPVSDFEEDSIHQKISRAALLSSLETVCEPQITGSTESFEKLERELDLDNANLFENNQQSICDKITEPDSTIIIEKSSSVEQDKTVETNNIKDIDNCDIESNNEIQKEKVDMQEQDVNTNTTMPNTSSDDVISDCIKDLKEPESKIESEVIENNVDGSLTPKQTVNKEQLAVDVQAIIKKLLMYFSGTGSNSFKHNMETDYIYALQILETEIERIIQSLSPTASLENNSCNSSTIDSNNSDYGSDTIESLDCMTDEDETSDSKNRGNAKYPIVDLFSTAYKMQAGSDLNNINISNETLSIWKRLIQSLQKDSFCMNDNKLYDPNTEARLYIRDQIVNLMHTVTVNENKIDEIDQSVLDIKEKEIEPSLIEENNLPEDINEAFNVTMTDNGLLTYHSEDEEVTVTKIESSDEGISVESSENLKIHKTNDVVFNDIELHRDSNNDIESDPNKILFTDEILCTMTDSDNLDENDKHINSQLHPEKINVDEVDLKLSINSSRKTKCTDNVNIPLFVDIEFDDKMPAAAKQTDVSTTENAEVKEEDITKRSSLHLWISGETEGIEKDITDQEDITYLVDKDSSCVPHSDFSDLPSFIENSSVCDSEDTKHPEKSYRDTGYYSFKSSDDNFLHDTPPPDEFMDVPNFKSLKRSVKKFPLSNTLSKSTNNINQVFSVPDTKFSTLQLKSHKSKGSSNSTSSPSRQFTSLFSPTAVFKKLTGSKGNDSPTPESSIPQKYLKKYARSSSIDSESIIGAISMPQLNYPKSSDSYSALGLYSENDRDSSIIADDDIDVKRYSHSVLSLGTHSASMTSVYSAAACHYGYVTVSGDVLFGLNYNQKSQMMEVFVKQCRNLAAVDARRNKSDPYVKVYLLPDKTKSGKRKTKTKKNTLNPVFNELLRFPVLKHELESRTLWLSVWNSDLFGRNDFLGEITLPLGYRLLDSPTLRWYPLQERMESLTSPLNYRGELFLALKYVPRDLSLESRFRPAPVISLRGALHVLVKEARNISVNGSGGNLDAFCKSYLLPDKNKSSKQKTPVVKKSRHPKWYYTVIYEDLSVDELKERSLELTVWDHDKITSNEFMGGVRLNIGSGLYHGVSVEWMDARRDEAALWQAMLQSPNMWVDGCLPLRPTMQFHHG